MKARFVLVLAALLACGTSDNGGAPPSVDAGAFEAGDGAHDAGTAGPPACTACTATFGAPVRVSDGAPGTMQREPFAIEDGKGRVYVAYMDHDAASKLPSLRYAVSTDGGRSFGASRAAGCGPLPLGGDPAMVVDSADRVFLSCMNVVIQPDKSQRRLVYLVRIDEPSEAVLVSDDRDEQADREWMAVDGQDRIYVVWLRGFHLADRELRLAVSEDHGKTFAPSSRVAADTPDGRPLFATIAAHRDGLLDVAIAIGEYDALASRAVYFTRGRPGAFPVPRKLPGVTSARATSVKGVYGFQAPVVQSLPDGSSVVAWAKQAEDDADAVQIVAARTADGTTFGAPRRLDDGSRALRNLPWLAADERGGLHALWLELAADGWSTRYAYSPEAATVRPTKLTTAPFGGDYDTIGEFISLTTRGARVHAAWTESHGGDEDVYYARGELRE